MELGWHITEFNNAENSLKQILSASVKAIL
jgi:hypothetical protein